MTRTTELSDEALIVANLLTSPLTAKTAVTITGAWGGGKTEIANEVARHLRKRREPGRCFGWRIAYLSLFGVSSLTQVHDMMKTALSREIPQPSRLMSAISVDFAKTLARKITGRKDSLFEVALNSIALDTSTLVIFDDLERSSMPAVEILGYIDRFVRNEDCRVLMICEESRYSDHHSDQDAAAFNDFFEKISGHRVHVKGGRTKLEESICERETSLLNDNDRKYLIAAALSAYRQAGEGNLRVLKSVISDMIRLHKYLPKKIPYYSGAFDGMLFAYAACCIETKLGRISYKEVKTFLRQRENAFVSKLHSQDRSVSEDMMDAINRYDMRIIQCRYVPVEALRSIAFNISLDEVHVKDSIIKCIIDSSRPFYETLKNFNDATDEDLSYACGLAEQEIDKPTGGFRFFQAIECLTEFTPYLKKVAGKDNIRERAMSTIRSTCDFTLLWDLVGYNMNGEKPLGNVARDAQSLANAILMQKIEATGKVGEKPSYIPIEDIELLRSSLDRASGADAILEMFDEKSIANMLCHSDPKGADRIRMIFNTGIQDLYRQRYPRIESMARLILMAIETLPDDTRRNSKLPFLKDTATSVLQAVS